MSPPQLAPIATESSDDAQLSSTTENTIFSPTTNEILRICPRFRLLIIGNSGVGKSTLIRSVFGVKDVDISDASRGRAEIDREYIAEENNLFVVHDSLGLEAAESDHLELVKKFIDGRRRREELKDRLHAIWVCIQVPYASGRVLEAGMEDFLRNRKDIVGDIPVVVVMTKLDFLDNSLMTDLRKEGVQFRSIQEAKPHLEPRRSDFLKKHCGGPLQKATGGDIPYVAVSTKKGYQLEPTIPELIKTTTSEIERYISADPSISASLYVARMAQRASIQAKVEVAIAIGRKRYWSNFGACSGFSAEKLEKYLLILHRDIVQTWNFNDPQKVLESQTFTEYLLDTSDLGVDIPRAKAGQSSTSLMTLLLNDPAALAITLPLTGAVALGKFCFGIHKSAKTIVKCSMAYIVDLINVMKILFILAPQESITSEDVTRALDIYKKLPYRRDIHKELKDFSASFAVLPKGRDVVVDKIETLVRQYNVSDEELSLLRLELLTAASRRP